MIQFNQHHAKRGGRIEISWVFLGIFSIVAGSCLTGCTLPSCRNVAYEETDLFHTYQQNCAGCHGAQMQGISGPELRKIGAKFTPDQIKTVILNGGTGMPSFDKRLNDKQVKALVDYLANEK